MSLRVLTAVTVIVILFQALLALAFFAGYYWVGGWEAGALFCGGLLLLVLLPWTGSLEADYDTDGHRVSVRLSWWGRLMVQREPEPIVAGRVLGIPWRKRLKAKEPPEETEEEAEEPDEEEAVAERPSRWRAHLSGMSAQDIIRLVPVALQGIVDLLWEARELKLKVQAPTGNDFADTAIAAVVGHRGLGSLDLRCTATGERRLQVHFRIGMLRAGLAVLYLVIQARPLELALKARARKKEEESQQALAEAKEAD